MSGDIEGVLNITASWKHELSSSFYEVIISVKLWLNSFTTSYLYCINEQTGRCSQYTYWQNGPRNRSSLLSPSTQNVTDRLVRSICPHTHSIFCEGFWFPEPLVVTLFFHLKVTSFKVLLLTRAVSTELVPNVCKYFWTWSRPHLKVWFSRC